MADDAEHYVSSVPVLNGPRRDDGTYGQCLVRCRCGWSAVSIYELRGEVGAQHYLRHGLAPQSVPFGYAIETLTAEVI